MKRRWAGQEPELNLQLRLAAEAGHGVLTLEDLRNLGVSNTMVNSRRSSGQFIAVLRGVVALPGTKLTEKGRARAATYVCGKQSFLSGRSALSLHGVVRERGPVEIARVSGAGHSKGDGLIRSEHFEFEVRRRQFRRIKPQETTVISGIRTLTVEKALLSYAGEATEKEIGKALSQAERERLLCWKTLRTLIDQANGSKGVGRLKREVAAWIPAYSDAGSEPEEELLRFIVRGGLPVPNVNEPLGDFVADFLWKPIRLVVELDPYGTHKGYEQFHRDRRKSVTLERMGYRVIRVTWTDLSHQPERLLAELRDIMVQQARLHGITSFMSI